MSEPINTPPTEQPDATAAVAGAAPCSALVEIQEAMNDLSTIRSGPTATSGYIDDMARAKARLNRAGAILADSLYKAEKRRAHGASTREMMREIFETPNAKGQP
jgi:hypothetical protein